MHAEEFRDLVSILNEAFLDYFVSIGYENGSILYRNLDADGEYIPDLPYIEYRWTNKLNKRVITVTTYSNFYTDLSIENLSTNESLSVNTYLKKEFKHDVGIHTMEGDTIESRFSAYLNFLRTILSTTFNTVLSGKEWFLVPIDWQGQK